ncbi:MAG: type II secretion system protein GspC [Pseudomonadota bacterium]
MLSLLNDTPKSTFRALQVGRIALSALVVVVLLVALAGRGALAVRDWRAAAQLTTATAAAGQTALPATDVDLPAVQALGLFGGAVAGTEAGRVPMVAATDLGLTLEGVVVGSNAADSIAIIVSNSRQHGYRVGETLPVGVSVTVSRVEKDHVILSNNGIEQALWLYGDDKEPRVANVVTPRLMPASGSVTLPAGPSAGSNAPQAAEQQIKQAQARLAEIIEVSPAVANGQLIGYSLSPGYRLKDFVQLGFKTNDIVTAVNGIALNDMANLSELYRLMNEAGDVSFSVLRDGQPLSLQMTMAP